MGRSDSRAEAVRCAIYTRVSSDEQARDGYSLDTQERLCREKLEATYGPDLYEVVVYTDDGYEHKWGLYDPEHPDRKFRPALTRMHEAFKRGHHEVICVWEFDRLYRKPALSQFLSENFIPYGLDEFISIKEKADIKTASGRLHMNIMAAVGAFEVERLGERVSDALDQRRHEGYVIGPPPYGWRWQTDGEMAPGQKRRDIAPVEEEGRVVRWMAERYLAGDSILTITQKLNERGVPTKRGGKRWSRSSVKRALANPKQAGLQEMEDGEYQRAHHYEHRHYDPEVFHQIRARMDRNAQHHTRTAHVPEYLLGGLIRCGHCGHLLNCRRVNRTNRRYYRCSTGPSRGTDTE
ncbi:MAG: recombinase family protein, partial [Armatimonadota bacterium]|nr:recombinase family protein [Armatimonadota bacterium]